MEKQSDGNKKAKLNSVVRESECSMYLAMRNKLDGNRAPGGERGKSPKKN